MTLPVPKNVEDSSEQFQLALQGRVLRSRDDVTLWASPITQAEQDEDWCVHLGYDVWRRMVMMERAGTIPESVVYELRRARRLNAFVPPNV
jgi:hypothetical protein